MSSEDSETLIVTHDEEGKRLDLLLADRYRQEQSRTYFQTLIEQGLVLLNGLPVKKRTQPKAGDEIEVQFVLSPSLELQAENIPLDILFEDEHLLAINKPAGMVVHPAVGNWSGTFVNALLYYCQQAGITSGSLFEATPEGMRPGIVHRLDKETSGVLIAAKTLLAQQRLVTLFSTRQMHKEYLAICCGNPGEITIDCPIGRHPVHRKKMCVLPTGGKAARTHCVPLAVGEKFSLVSILLETGRTHQIRVHMKHRGTPILGDSLYGCEQANRLCSTSRQMLHARLLRFHHPLSGQELTIIAPIPFDMQEQLKKNHLGLII